MAEAAPNIGVDAVFHKLLNARNEPHVSALQAKEIVARRDRLLSIYTQEGIPSQLKEYFAGAIKITDLCDQYAMTDCHSPIFPAGARKHARLRHYYSGKTLSRRSHGTKRNRRPAVRQRARETARPRGSRINNCI
jgi:hypothetical protein